MAAFAVQVNDRSGNYQPAEPGALIPTVTGNSGVRRPIGGLSMNLELCIRGR